MQHFGSLNLSQPLNQILGGLFDPLTLFADGEDGFLCMTGRSQLFQDSAATTPVTADDDPIGYWEDITGNGNHILQATSGDRPTRQTLVNGKNYVKVGIGTNSLDLPLSGGLYTEFTYLIAARKAIATTGALLSGNDQADYIGFFEANDTADAAALGFTNTVDSSQLGSVSINGSTRRQLLTKLTNSGFVVFATRISAHAAPGTNWTIGDGNNVDNDLDVTAIMMIDRLLTDDELAAAMLSLGQTFDPNYTVAPRNTTLVLGGTQSNGFGEGRAFDERIPVFSSDYGFELNNASPTSLVSYPLRDPVGDAVGSGAVPAWTEELFLQSGEYTAIIDAGVGGASHLPLDTSDWGDGSTSGGTARNNAISYGNAGINYLAENVNFNLTDVILHMRGMETEILNYNGTTIVPEDVDTFLIDLATDLNASLTQFDGLKISFLSPRYEDSAEEAMLLTEKLQNTNKTNTEIKAAAAASALIDVICSTPSSFMARNYEFDGVHDDTRGQQEFGKVSARGYTGSNQFPPLPAGPLLSTVSHIDESACNKSGKTYPITTADNTSCLMIGVVASAHSTTSNNIFLDAYLDNKKMNRAGIAFTEGAGQVAAALFYINEDEYGGSLANITGNVRVNSRLLNGTEKTVNVMHVIQYNAKDIYHVDRIEGNNAATGTAVASHDIVPAFDSWLINVTGANRSNGSSSQFTFTNLTELVDEEFTNTKTVHIASAHAEVSADASRTITATADDSMQDIASLTASMRAKVDGEGFIEKRALELSHEFHIDNSIPSDFTLSTGSEVYNDGGLELSGAGQYLDRTIDGNELYLDLSKPGYALVVFKPDELPNADQWLFSIHDGTSTPQIAMRIYRDDGTAGAKTPRMFVYPDTGANTTNYGKYECQVGVFDFAALVWQSGGQAKIITEDGEVSASIGTITPGNYSTIRFGDDHNGGAEFDGTFAKIVVGKSEKPLTLREVMQKAFITGDLPILIEGQSYNGQLFDSLESGNPVGHQAAQAQAQEILSDPNKIFLINATDSGSALLTSSDAADAWLDNSGASIVPHLRQLDAETDLFNKGLDPRAVWWQQYQGDVFDIAAGNTTIEDYKAGLEWKIARWRSLHGNTFPIMLEIPSGRNEAVTDSVDAAHQTMRECYLDVISENANVFGLNSYDIEPFDTTGHPTDAGHIVRARRAMRTILAQLGYEMGALSSVGPTANVSSAVGTTITVDITHDKGTGLSTPSTNYEGFKVFETDGTEISISSAVPNGANSIIITLASTPIGSEVDVKYPYGALEGVTLSELVYDNSAESMPLGSFYQRVAVTA